MLSRIPVGAAATLQLPTDVKTLFFKTGTETDQLNIPKIASGQPDKGFSASATITTKPTLGGDLLWAMGGHRIGKVVNLGVSVAPHAANAPPLLPQKSVGGTTKP